MQLKIFEDNKLLLKVEIKEHMISNKEDPKRASIEEWEK